MTAPDPFREDGTEGHDDAESTGRRDEDHPVTPGEAAPGSSADPDGGTSAAVGEQPEPTGGDVHPRPDVVATDGYTQREPGADDTTHVGDIAVRPPAGGEHTPDSGDGSDGEDAGFDEDGGAGDEARRDETAEVSEPAGVEGAGVEGDTGAQRPTDVDLPPLRAALEAVLLVVDEPVAEVVLAQVLERPTSEVAAVLRELADEYDAQGRGFDLRNVSGGWRLYTRPDCAPYVERFVLDGQQARLTQAALETLAVVAYRQPVTRGRVSAIRGVNVDGVMRTLLTRGLVEEAGTDGESGATLYRTTSYFLERLGLTSLDELPPVADHLPDLEALEADADAPST